MTPGIGRLHAMPSKSSVKLLQEVVKEVGVYPAEAYLFVQEGLTLTVEKAHAEQTDPDASRHVSGRQLCDGLRELAFRRWGRLAGTVLTRWNITTTLDFGRIVFAMVEHDLLQKTEEDTLDDFRNIFDLSSFDGGYRIEATMASEGSKKAERK